MKSLLYYSVAVVVASSLAYLFQRTELFFLILLWYAAGRIITQYLILRRKRHLMIQRIMGESK